MDKLTKSRFNMGMCTAMYLTVFLGLIAVLYVALFKSEADVLFNFIVLPMLFVALAMLIRIEIPKIKVISVSEKSMNIGYPVLGLTKQYAMESLDGFKTQLQPARIGFNESILIYKNGKCVLEISDLYYSNYFELKNQIEINVPFLGISRFKYFEYIIERIKWW
ncbi:hypothetical protein [Reichenbachiella sp.]|uniref:hypothetical protein n=1 Tax=Reichenbachiella sp. TaxID=2184521 RepID=UPI003BB0944C